MLRRLRLKKTFQVIILTLIAAMALYTPGIRAAASQDIKYQNSDAVPQDIQYENDEAKNDALILDWADVLTDTEEDELLISFIIHINMQIRIFIYRERLIWIISS